MPDGMGPVRLGIQQRTVLRSLIDHGSWTRGCGWKYGTPSQTIALLESLEKRGYALRLTAGRRSPAWVATADGRAAHQTLKKVR
jgi:hypothetical protein